MQKATHPPFYALRLRPGQYLKEELTKFIAEKGIRSGYIATCVGSLQKLHIRLANESITMTKEEKFEITSLVGTLCPDGLHIHIGVADRTGASFGGHLMDGNIIFTTAEIVIGVLDEWYTFAREIDEETTFDELVVREVEKKQD